MAETEWLHPRLFVAHHEADMIPLMRREGAHDSAARAGLNVAAWRVDGQ
jgi:hypothetical protein